MGLVITRRAEESVDIGTDIRVTLLGITPDKHARLSIFRDGGAGVVVPRGVGEIAKIDDEREIKVCGVRDRQVTLNIEAPRNEAIVRTELYARDAAAAAG
ncbi:MAG: carbon storage regulator [Pseudomonadota bacterium]